MLSRGHLKTHCPTKIILHYCEKYVCVNKHVYKKIHTYLCEGSVLIYVFDSQCINRCWVMKIQNSASLVERSQFIYFSNAVKNAQFSPWAIFMPQHLNCKRFNQAIIYDSIILYIVYKICIYTITVFYDKNYWTSLKNLIARHCAGNWIQKLMRWTHSLI